MTKIDIIGRGNVAFHLENALRGKADVAMVNPRTLEGVREDAELLILAVSDAAIPSVAARLANHKGIIAHTSGTTDLRAIHRESGSTGVFYPLQTFSKDVVLNYSEIPFFIEGDTPATTEFLTAIASLISPKVRPADSIQRRKLHLASVLSCNFVNHLWTLADRYLSEAGLDFADLFPLIRETAAKVERTSPFAAQTGPARRHDQVTIRHHLEMLKDSPELRNIYATLSESIGRTHPEIK